jgi:hypothetical protein
VIEELREIFVESRTVPIQEELAEIMGREDRSNSDINNVFC